MSEVKRAVIYCRVSTKEQVEEGNSLATQEKICKEYALKNGYEVAELFIEQGESAKTQDRPELKKLLSYCADRKKRIDAVIAYKIDRISRNTDDYSQIRILLKRYKVEIKSTSEYFENTPAGRFMENIIANVAQFDNDVRTERSVNGMKDAMREGRYVWAAPFGYSNIRIGGRATIAPNEKGLVMRMAFEEVAKNKNSVDEIRRQMSKEGLTNPKGKPLCRGQFYRLLKNDVYAGHIIKFGERHRGLYEPIVSQEVFDQVQRVLKRRSHKSFIYQRENPDFPLRRFVKHPSGTKLTGAWSKGNTKRYAYYRFTAIKQSDIRKESLEKAFMAFINGFKLEDQLIINFRNFLGENLDKATLKDFKVSERLKVEIAELKEKQTALIEKNMAGVITNEILRQQLDLIEEKLMKATASLVSLSDRKEGISELFDFANDYLQNPARVWSQASFQKKIALQWFEFPEGTTFDGRKFRTPEIASIFKVKDFFLTRLSPNVHFKLRITNNPEVATFRKRDRKNKGFTKSTPKKKFPKVATKIAICEKLRDDLKKLVQILKGEPVKNDSSFPSTVSQWSTF